MIIGHGLRDRQVRGPLAPDDPPRTRVLRVRRYLCRRCGAVLVVLPRGVVARRHFAATAIAWAFALVGLLGRTQASAWAAVSGWGEPRSRWITFARWAAAAVEGRLFGVVRGAGSSRTGPAARVATVIRSMSPVRGILADEVFAGALVAAHAR